MKRNLLMWQFGGFVAVSLLGVVLHFLFDWTGITFTALFSAVNESTWEHMKLIFFPMLVFALIENCFWGKGYEGFWCIKFQGILIGMLLIPIMFYTLRGVFGTTPDWINIAIFFASAAAALAYETKLFLSNDKSYKYCKSAFVIICVIAVCFGVFTFITPEIPLFQNPIDGSYGIFCFTKEG